MTPPKGIIVGIICPRGARTGGPEALHQLYAELRSQGVETLLVDPSFSNVPSEPEYEKYGPQWMIDSSMLSRLTHLVVPETTLTLPRVFHDSFHGKVIFWWLSVDNSPHPWSRLIAMQNLLAPTKQWGISVKRKLRHLFGLIYGVWTYFSSRVGSKIRGEYLVDLASALHLSQSEYATDFIHRHFSHDVLPCSDYLTEQGTNVPPAKPRSLITFNGSKGAEFVLRVSKYAPNLEFFPLRGISKSEVFLRLQESRVYIDLGTFPGKDRIPREARRSGTPVILGRRGSAAFRRDFNLPEKYTVDFRHTSPSDVAEMLQNVFVNYDQALRDQESFAEAIASEKLVFSSEVSALVARLRGDHET